VARPVLVALHAHPDDEAIFTGGTIVRAVEAGWRVVLVVATDGDRGVGSGATRTELAAHRRAETRQAAAVLGIERVVFLGHGDSGYVASFDSRGHGGATGRGLEPGTLASAHIDGVVAEVRGILIEEGAVALTSYDDNGIYGHVDHVLVHEIAARAVRDTGCELYESTLERSALRRIRQRLIGRGLVADLWPASLNDQLGVESGADVVPVDVSRQLDLKLLAIAAHSSQVMEAPSFMGLPAGVFHHLLATEWFRVARAGTGRLLAAVDIPVGAEERAALTDSALLTEASGRRSGPGLVDRMPPWDLGATA
jgi:LmbE family N-acetylglucosaminyl deacetylase